LAFKPQSTTKVVSTKDMLSCLTQNFQTKVDQFAHTMRIQKENHVYLSFYAQSFFVNLEDLITRLH
jgi:hypothetical protein